MGQRSLVVWAAVSAMVALSACVPQNAKSPVPVAEIGDAGPAVPARAVANPPAAFDRRAPRSAAAERTLALGAQVGAPGAPLIDAEALEPFFSSLDNTAQKRGRSRIVVFGNSLIISDRIVDIWRERMVTRFGDAGRGFVFADRMANYGSKARTGDPARGFTAFNVSWGPKAAYPQGASVALHVGRKGARTTWATEGARSARLFWLDHKRAPALRLSSAAATPWVIEPRRTGAAQVTALTLPAASVALTLQAQGPRAVVYGVSLEHQSPGIILDNLSAIGADSGRFLRADADVFTTQLAALAPNLVTLLLGGNEVKRVAWGGSDAVRVRRDLKKMIAQVREAVPHAACLVTGPLENVYGAQPTKKKSARRVAAPWRMRPQTEVVATIMRDEAHRAGCGYFDTFGALGGEGALRRLHNAGLMNRDMIHPRGRGLDLIGDLLSDAVLDAYEAGAVGTKGGAPRGPPGHARRAGQNGAESDMAPATR